jgi:hypothetical protein
LRHVAGLLEARRAQELIARVDAIEVPTWIAALLVLAVTMLSWQALGLVGAGGLDASWQAGLSLATDRGLSFGHDVVFTYGPLGFVGNAPIDWVSGLTIPSFVYVVLQRVGLVGAMLFGAREAFGRGLLATIAAALLAGYVASLINTPVETSALMVLAAWVLRHGITGRRAYAMAGFIGIATAIELLNKFSIGLAFAVMSAVLLLVLPQRRWSLVLTGLVSAFVAFVVSWLALGASITAIPGYIWSAEQVSTGYAAAMSILNPAENWVFGFYLIMLFAGIWAAWDTTVGQPTRQRLGLVVVWVAFWFFGFKESIVRFNVFQFVSQLIVGWFAFGQSAKGRRSADVWRLLSGVAVVLCVFAVVRTGSFTSGVHPKAAATAAVDNVKQVFSPRQRDSAIAATRASVMATEKVSPQTIAQLRGHTVSVFGGELDVAWAYQLNWDPIPVLQSYSAYTPYLDHLDARFVNSSRAPSRILLQASGAAAPNLSIDDRVLGFDEPATTRAILCNYRPLSAAGTWTVLTRTDQRCSATERLLEVHHLGWGQAVSIPRPPTPHSFVVARVSGTDVGGAESLGSFFFKPAIRYIGLDGTYYRFVSANEGDGLVLRSGDGFDAAGPFALVPQSHVLSFSRTNPPADGHPITVRFYVGTYSS